jgi:nitrite reductase/ring-hydroxylating ferredoxin subunit
VGGKSVIISVSTDGGKVRVAPNVCTHFAAPFAPDLEDVGKMKCTMHGMQLDPFSMEYVKGSNPKLMGATIKNYGEGGAGAQAEYAVSAKAADGSVTITAPEGLTEVAASGGCELA